MPNLLLAKQNPFVSKPDPSKTACTQRKRGQSMVELAIALPVVIMVLMGLIEIAYAGRTYLALLTTATAGSRLGSQGAALFTDSEINTYILQNLASEKYTGAALVDVIIVRADLPGGTTVQNYVANKMQASSYTTTITQSVLSSRLRSGDLASKIIGVEILYNHRLLLNFPILSNLFPDPFILRAYSIHLMQR